jgi:hypothetical protein
MIISGWCDELFARLDGPATWSPARREAERQWALIWRGPTRFAIASNNRVVSVERRKRPSVWKQAA